MTTSLPASAAAADAPRDGVRSLLARPDFRGLMLANVLAATGFGASRFVFVWLIGELTDWNPATAILGIVIGLPPLFLSAWAGSLADRLDPRRFGVATFVLSGIGFAVTAALVVVDVMTVPLAMVLGFVTAIAPAMLMPLMQALVPAVVPPAQLMQGVAVQNLTMTVSVVAGVFLAGAVMQMVGVAAGFWLVAGAGVLGALVFLRSPLPAAVDTTRRPGAIREGARFALGTQPLQSLLGITAVLGMAIATVTLLLPEFARDVLGAESLAASALNVCMSLGMTTTSMLIATRWTPSRPGLVLTAFSVVTMGGGLVAIGLTRVYVVTALCSLVWGLCGGVMMTTLRTLTQSNTPPELMGRVMGLVAMAQNGMFPIGALVLVGLVSATSVSTAMVISGFICVAGTGAIALRPHVRSL